MAKEYVESNRLGDAEDTIAAAEKFLAALPDSETIGARADIAALRDEIARRPTEDEQNNLRAAKNTLRAARSSMSDRQLSSAEMKIQQVEKFLANVREQHHGEIGADFAALKAEYAAAYDRENPAKPTAPAPVAAPAPAAVAAPAPAAVAAAAPAAVAAAAPVPVAAPAPAAVAAPAPVPAAAAAAVRPLTDDEYSAQSRARSTLRFAREAAESPYPDRVESQIENALALVATLPDFAAAPLLADIAEIRAIAARSRQGETHRRLVDELDRNLDDRDPDLSRTDIVHGQAAKVEARLADPEVTAALTADEIAGYRTRIAALRAKASAFVKADALDRVQPLIAELEEGVQDDPFDGLDLFNAQHKATELRALRMRIVGALSRAADPDDDIRAIEARVAATDRKIDAAWLAWGKAKLDTEVSNSWSSIEKEIAGWEAEADHQDARGLHDPELPLTRRAIQRTRYLLVSDDTKKLRAEHAGDAAIEGPFQTAESVLADAGAKMAAAYDHILEQAEKLATPLDQFTLARPPLLAYGAEASLEGTPHRDRIAGRARALDTRWKAEVAEIMRSRQELYDKLAGEADKSWPYMRDKLEPERFDPRTVQPGMLVRLDRVYNRCGWDYGSRAYDFAVRSHDVVIGGVYAPHVLAALKHAWYELKLDVNDRIPWDIIAIVEGTAKIGKRTQVSLRDESTGLEIGKLEEWPAIDCLKVKIVGLHAGPVAVAQRD